MLRLKSNWQVDEFVMDCDEDVKFFCVRIQFVAAWVEKHVGDNISCTVIVTCNLYRSSDVILFAAPSRVVTSARRPNNSSWYELIVSSFPSVSLAPEFFR